MEIAADKVVLIHYTLKDDSGAVLDSSAGGEPLAYIQGHGNLVPGLEKALERKQGGNTLTVTLAPADGYGTREQKLVQRVPRRSLQGAGEIKKGMQFQARTDDGMRVFTVTGVAPHPAYFYDPARLTFTPAGAKGKLRIAPGPNNPVGVAWIGLNLPGYGIHGTPKPEDIGALLEVIAAHLTAGDLAQQQKRAREWLTVHATKSK